MKRLKTLVVGSALMAVTIGAAGASAQSLNEFIEIPSTPSTTHSSATPAGGSGGGGDIIVFDIVYSTPSENQGRPAGGDGGGGDIIVWDIVHSAAPKNQSRPAGGGGDIVVWDIVDSVASQSDEAGGEDRLNAAEKNRRQTIRRGGTIGSPSQLFLTISAENETNKETPAWWEQVLDLTCPGGWIMALDIDEDGEEVVTDVACDD